MRNLITNLRQQSERAQLAPTVRLVIVFVLAARWFAIGLSLLLSPDSYSETIYRSTFKLAPQWVWGVGFLAGTATMACVLLYTLEPPFRLTLVIAAFVETMWGLSVLGTGAEGLSGPMNWLGLAAADVILATSKEIAYIIPSKSKVDDDPPGGV